MNGRPVLWALFLWALLPCAVVLVLAAALRGAEYDEQYTLFLTAGVARPEWPVTVFPAGLARDIQAGHAGPAPASRATCGTPTCIRRCISGWSRCGATAAGQRGCSRRGCSRSRWAWARSALTGVIARSVRVPPMRAMLLTLGCYGFAYTSMVARGFALAQLLLLSGVVSLLAGRRGWHFTLAGMCFGAATLTNYLSVFVATALV